MINQNLYIDVTEKKGRGVFTKSQLEKDIIIEISPVIVMSQEDRAHLDKTLLHDYIFEWGKHQEQCCMALGFIPMYNHHYSSNCEYFMDFDEESIFIKTVREIKAGEELTINYNGDWDNKEKIWFDTND